MHAPNCRLVSNCRRNCMCRLGVVVKFAKDVKYTHPIQTSVDLRQKLHVSTQGCHRICKRCRIHAPNTNQCRFEAETACVDLGLSQNLQKMYGIHAPNTDQCRSAAETACVDLGLSSNLQKMYGIHAPNTDQCRFAAETACVDLGLSQNLQKMQNTSSQYRLVSICGRNCMCRLRNCRHRILQKMQNTSSQDRLSRQKLPQKLHVSTQGCRKICKRCQNTRTQYRLVSICGRNCMCRLGVVIEFAKDVKYTHPIQTSVDLRQKLHVSTQGCRQNLQKMCRIHAPNTDQCRFAAETACVDLGLSQNLQKMQNTRTQYRVVSICGRNCMCRLRIVVEFAKDVKYTHPIQTKCRFAAETACVDLGLSQNLQKMYGIHAPNTD